MKNLPILFGENLMVEAQVSLNEQMSKHKGPNEGDTSTGGGTHRLRVMHQRPTKEQNLAKNKPKKPKPKRKLKRKRKSQR